MEELITKLEDHFQQKLEVFYGKQIIIKSSPSNPSEAEQVFMMFDDLKQAIQTIKTLINLNGVQQKTASERVIYSDHS